MRYSQQLLEHFYHPLNVGTLDDSKADVGSAMVGTLASGNVIKMSVRIANEKIIDVKYKVHGSGPAVAASCYVSEWAKQKTLAEVAKLNSQDIVDALAIPAVRVHCALLAEDALKAAIANYKEKLEVIA